MGLERGARTVSLAVLFVVGVALSFPTAAEQPPAFSGSARDTLGRVLAGVEVLLAPPGAPERIPSVTRTDRSGRFEFRELLPDRYRIAALKDGYLVYVGMVDTAVDTWVDVVLHPIPEPGMQPGPPVPEDPSWSLRVPRRSVLRETDLPEDDALIAFATDTPTAEQPLQVQVDQLVAVQEGAGQGARLRGTHTRVSLASALGSAGTIRVQGTHGSLRADEALEAGSVHGRSTASLDVLLAYETGFDSRVDVRAFFDRDALRWTSPLVGPGAGTRQERQRWGYNAEWIKRLTDRSDIAVLLDYRDTFLALPIVDAVPQPVPSETGVDPSPSGLLSRQAIAAAGRYHVSPSHRHDVDVTAQTRLIREPYGSLEAVVQGTPEAYSAVNAALDAQDVWNVGGPVSLISGVGYRQGIGPDETSWAAPRVGARIASDDVQLDVVVSYHTPTGGEPVRGNGRVLPEDRVGYEARMAVSIAEGLEWIGSSSYSPVEMAFVRSSDRAPQGFDPTDLSDGNASIGRHAVGLAGRTRSMRTFFTVERGRAEGDLTTLHLFDNPMSGEADRRLEYNTGRFGMSFDGSGTDFVVQYEDVGQTSGSDETESAMLHQRSLELGVSQDLLRMQNFGTWRFLMAVRMFSLESEGRGEATDLGDHDAFVVPSSGELSVGLSVAF